MNLEIISKFQWYRRLLRRFDSVFANQNASSLSIEHLKNDIAALRQENEEFKAVVSKLDQQIFDIKQLVEDLLKNDIAAFRQENHDAILKILWVLRNRPFSSDIEKKDPAYERLLRLRELMQLRDVEGKKLVRIGRPHDGGYLMLDEFQPSMIAYSFGICDDVSWDKDMVKQGIECFMYDHTIDSLPEKHELFCWRKEGICGNDPVEQCRTLAEFIQINGHEERKDLILKMDVEGAEWDAIAATPSETLAQFSQMVFEFHDMYSPMIHEKICTVLVKLNKTHQPVWVHGNNWADYERVGDLAMPWALEVLYVRKGDHSFIESNHFYPSEQDMPNNTSRHDIRLGVWNIH